VLSARVRVSITTLRPSQSPGVSPGLPVWAGNTYFLSVVSSRVLGQDPEEMIQHVATNHVSPPPIEPCAPGMSDRFWSALALIEAEWDLLKHPFFEQWRAQDLDPGQLCVYAEEHDHLALALSDSVECAVSKLAPGPTRDAIAAEARHQRSCVTVWRKFARLTGWGPASAWYYGSESYPETDWCVQAWRGSSGRPVGLDLVTLHAAECVERPVQMMLLEGFLPHREFDPKASTCFGARAANDLKRRAHIRSALEVHLGIPDHTALLAQADLTLRCHWRVLDRICFGESPKAELPTRQGARWT
jgi:hypothetical protein